MRDKMMRMMRITRKRRMRTMVNEHNDDNDNKYVNNNQKKMRTRDEDAG